MAGCEKAPPVIEKPVLFCDVEESRRFTQEEWNWRAEHAPWNLRRDVKTNTTWDRECADKAPPAKSDPAVRHQTVATTPASN